MIFFYTLIFVLLLHRKCINLKTNQIFGVGVQILLKWRTNIWEIVHKYAWGWGGEGWGGNSVTKPFMRDIPSIKGWNREYWLLIYNPILKIVLSIWLLKYDILSLKKESTFVLWNWIVVWLFAQCSGSILGVLVNIWYVIELFANERRFFEELQIV